MKNLLIKQTLVILLVSISILANAQEVQLKYNFVKGKKYSITSEIKSAETNSMGGQERTIDINVNANCDMYIEDVDKDENATVLYKLLNTHVQIPMMRMDSTFTFNETEQQQRVLLSKDGNQVLESKPAEDKRMMMVNTDEIYTRLPLLPKNSIKVGDKWTEKMVDSTKASPQSPFSKNTTTNIEYTFDGKEVKDGIEYLKVSFTSSISLEGKGSMNGTDLFIEGTGKAVGFTYFNPKTSMVNYMEDNTEMDMSIAISGQQNMTMPMTSTKKMTTTIVEKN